MSITEQTLDVRELAPRLRHEHIFAALAALAGGEALRLVNNHDPRPLRHQLEAEQPAQFSWDYLERGPERWAVRIARLAATPTPQPADAAVGAGQIEPQPEASSGEHYLDNRGLEPPEPLVRILEALATLAPDQQLTSDLDREPLLLYPELANRGFSYETAATAAGGYRIRIWRRS